MLKASYDASSNPKIKPLQFTIMYHDCMDHGSLLTNNLSQDHMIISHLPGSPLLPTDTKVVPLYLPDSSNHN